MPAHFHHEKLRADQEALRFVAWSEPVLEMLTGKTAARDQLDLASTSVVLNIAEGNGKRSAPDRCRFLDIARSSGLECAACLDVIVAKDILIGVVSMIAGLIARFSPETLEDQSPSDHARAHQRERER